MAKPVIPKLSKTPVTASIASVAVVIFTSNRLLAFGPGTVLAKPRSQFGDVGCFCPAVCLDAQKRAVCRHCLHDIGHCSLWSYAQTEGTLATTLSARYLRKHGHCLRHSG